MIFVFNTVENIVGKKEENAGHKQLLQMLVTSIFPQCFLKAFYSWSLKVRILCWRVNSLLDDIRNLIFPEMV